MIVLALAFRADAASHHHILLSVEEFTAFAGRIANKVNLFRDTWAQDPGAEFFGGTSRDYLYWLRGKLLWNVNSRADIERNMAALERLPIIDVRDFIVGESDVDIISGRGVSLSADQYGVKKIDVINPVRLDPNTDLGWTERNQGYIPVEKIRLSSHGVIPWPELGDGARELWTGHLSVHFAPRETFDQTYYARNGRNHPVLLALRYVRLLATHYFYEHGREYPERNALLALAEPGSLDAVQRVIRESIIDSRLARLLRDPAFAEKLNATVHKAFRAYTNPTAAHMLFSELGLMPLIGAYKQIEPVNQYLFAKHRNRADIERHLAEFGVDPAAFYGKKSNFFSDGKLYHGTRTEEAFRSILFNGVLQSGGGDGGAGLYGVPYSNVGYAGRFCKSEDRVIGFEIADDAKIVDVTRGVGAHVYDEFFRRYRGKNNDDFADYFGVDVMRYRYRTDAFVVKNGAVLRNPNGYRRQLMTLGALIELARKASDPGRFEELAKSLKINSVSAAEKMTILGEAPVFQGVLRAFREGNSIKTIDSAVEALRLDRFSEEDRKLLSGEFAVRKLWLLSSGIETREDFEALARLAKTRVPGHEILPLLRRTPFHRNVLQKIRNREGIDDYLRLFAENGIEGMSGLPEKSSYGNWSFNWVEGTVFRLAEWLHKNPPDFDTTNLVRAIADKAVTIEDRRTVRYLTWCQTAGPMTPAKMALLEHLVEVGGVLRDTGDTFGHPRIKSVFEEAMGADLGENPALLKRIAVLAGDAGDGATVHRLMERLIEHCPQRELVEALIDAAGALKDWSSYGWPGGGGWKDGLLFQIAEKILRQPRWRDDIALQQRIVDRTGTFDRRTQHYLAWGNAKGPYTPERVALLKSLIEIADRTGDKRVDDTNKGTFVELAVPELATSPDLLRFYVDHGNEEALRWVLARLPLDSNERARAGLIEAIAARATAIRSSEVMRYLVRSEWSAIRGCGNAVPLLEAMVDAYGALRDATGLSGIAEAMALGPYWPEGLELIASLVDKMVAFKMNGSLNLLVRPELAAHQDLLARIVLGAARLRDWETLHMLTSDPYRETVQRLARSAPRFRERLTLIKALRSEGPRRSFPIRMLHGCGNLWSAVWRQ